MIKTVSPTERGGEVMEVYYLRTEPDADAVAASMTRGRSLDEWGLAGADALSWLDNATDEELFDVAREVARAEGLPLPRDRDDAYLLAQQDADEELIVRVLGLEPWPGGGWCRYLPGLCALQECDEPPDPAEALAEIQGSHYAQVNGVLVLYEGDPVGIDPAEGWPLFRPRRVAWQIDLPRH
jgi:hypothetical protein